ncbi:RDD family protein [Sulfitobacter sp. LCG007]
MNYTPDPQTQAQFYRDVPLKRLLAWVVDTIVTVIACVLILPFTAFTGLFFLPALYVTVNFIYRFLTLAGGSATWGMRLFAIELRQADGSRLGGGSALMHTIGYVASWAVAPLQLISVVMMAVTERGQGLTDHALGTVAINRRASD